MQDVTPKRALNRRGRQRKVAAKGNPFGGLLAKGEHLEMPFEMAHLPKAAVQAALDRH